MKMKSIIAILLLLVFVLVTHMGCDFAVSIEQRIEMFVTDLNTDRDNAYLNFLPDNPLDYDVIKGPTVWDASFPVGDGTPYSYSAGDLNTSVPSDVELELYGPIEFGLSQTMKFVMVQDGLSWYIRELYKEGSPIVPRP